MQSLYSVIKKNCANPTGIYTIIQPPPKKTKSTALEKKEAEEVSVDLQAVRDQADAIICEAEKRSREIISSAEREAIRIKKDAYDSGQKNGYSDGYNKGFEQGKKEGLNDVAAIRNDAAEVLEEAHRISREYIRNQQNEIIKLALHIAEKIIGYEADMNDSVVYNIARRAIEDAVVKKQLTIRVNPMDYALLDVRRDELINAAGDNVIINIIRDNDIKRGGCRLESECSFVDAAIDSQFEKIKEALAG